MPQINHNNPTEYYYLNIIEKRIELSLLETKIFQSKLNDLEEDINFFLNQYYKYFFPFRNYTNLWFESILLFDLNQAKKNIYRKISEICAHESYNFVSNVVNNQSHEDLLKIERYFTYGAELSIPPQNRLENLIFEHYVLMQQTYKLKEQKKIILGNSAYELKPKVGWINLKATEVIEIIKKDLTHCISILN